MNTPRDFAELDCSDTRRRDIALAIALWNTQVDQKYSRGRGGLDFQAVSSRIVLPDSYQRPRNWARVCRWLGLKP